MSNERELTYGESIREAFDQLLEDDSSVYLIGEGVPDPKCIFGTTKGLAEKYGPSRVFDMPVAENGLTGVALGSAIVGMKPIIMHQRMDFTLYSLDQVINNIAKWRSMYGGVSQPASLVIRMIIGQGWGQGNQHSQNLQNLYAHIPGLKVVMPSNAYDAKGMMIAAVRDPNPVIFIEHRWLHNTKGMVPDELYEVPIGKAEVVREGSDITIVTWSYWVWEALKACEFMEKQGIYPELIDLKSLNPLDREAFFKSVKKTGKLLVVDGSWRQGGFAAEILASVAENTDVELKKAPKRVTFPDFPSPSTPGLTKDYYPTLSKIFKALSDLSDKEISQKEVLSYEDARLHDVPDKNFTGPF